MKLYRAKHGNMGKIPETPRTKTRKLLRNFGNSPSKKEKIKRTLFQHLTLSEELRNKYRGGCNRMKSTLVGIVKGQLMRKYNLVISIRNHLGFFFLEVENQDTMVC